jgi:hypothetical protein
LKHARSSQLAGKSPGQPSAADVLAEPVHGLPRVGHLRRAHRLPAQAGRLKRGAVMGKLIITAALTGAEVGKAQQPALPITPEEIGIAAAECVAAGAAIVHLHGRLADGTPTQDAAVYREIIEAVRARCDAIIQVSTGGAVGMTAAERLAPVTLAPEMATLSMGSVNFGE